MNQIDNPCLLVTDLPEHLTVKKLDGDDEVEFFLCAKPKKAQAQRYEETCRETCTSCF